MSSPRCFQATYKHVDEQQIDVDVYLPSSQNAKSPVCTSATISKYIWAYCHRAVINIHGGAFMLGSSKMVNKDQVQDCLSRGWIVLAPNHRLCPQVDLLNGPIQDCRDLLAWVYDGGLERGINDTGQSTVIPDTDHVFAFGTSSGGTLALCLGFGIPRPVAGIYDMYGPCNFSDRFWTTKLPHLKVPVGLTESFMNKVFEEHPVPITGGVSLEGQSTGPPDFNDPRQAYALTRLANGTILDAIFPSKDWDMVDPVRNISSCFPPTFIAHGIEDSKVPIGLSRELFRRLKDHGVHCDMREIPVEDHTFAAKMQVGSQTWELQRLGFDFLESLIYLL